MSINKTSFLVYFYDFFFLLYHRHCRLIDPMLRGDLFLIMLRTWPFSKNLYVYVQKLRHLVQNVNGGHVSFSRYIT